MSSAAELSRKIALSVDVFDDANFRKFLRYWVRLMRSNSGNISVKKRGAYVDIRGDTRIEDEGDEIALGRALLAEMMETGGKK